MFREQLQKITEKSCPGERCRNMTFSIVLRKVYKVSAILLATYTPLADAWDREWVTPLPSPMI